ncbi:MAG TPA: HPr family phosphocarrier protein [Candidatus Mediterraneibacter stercoravium]|uniref:HPr family phosphocarrier protein n=1 Tax=Candidatus Mediterraneibacter stercoravium TaxID=2838685 RepID=A0A9D2GC12_9FIRM|nr:HPr family phosphocarrier protein [Candidatus Mediterraneibacter stercoravium]
MRKSMNIQFRNYDMVERFSKDIANMKGEFDLVSGRKVVDAKSFLGIFSLDLSAPLVLNAVTDDDQAFAVFRQYQV